MQQHTLIVCFIIFLIIVYLNGNIYHKSSNDDNYNLYKLFQKRKSSSFTTAQRKFQEQMLKAHNHYRSRLGENLFKMTSTRKIENFDG
jgi:hypothetical protein